MKNRYLIVVDMQNDFISGSLGTPEAASIVPTVIEKISNYEGTVIFTQDTHFGNYFDTQEGKNLPVMHCIKDTYGWELEEELKKLQKEKNCAVFEKSTFGSAELAQEMINWNKEAPITEIEIIGLCTDICVVSNALLLKDALPEVPIFVDASCCAGVTVSKHQAALETMSSCQIGIR